MARNLKMCVPSWLEWLELKRCRLLLLIFGADVNPNQR